MKTKASFSLYETPKRGPLTKVRRKHLEKVLNGYCEDDCGENCGTNQD